MSEVIELLALHAVVEDVRPVLLATTGLLGATAVPTGPPRLARQQRWSSTLADQDLQCLLGIIECSLIPQLLTSYSPARHATFVLPLATE